MFRRLLSRLAPGALGVVALACTHQVAPKVTPEKIPSVNPQIKSRVVLLIAPGFEDYTSQENEGIHHYVYHLGESAAKAVTDLVTGSFAQVDVERVTDAQVLQWLASPGDTSKADLLLVPNFGKGGTKEGLFTVSADVTLRVDARVYRSGAVYSWVTQGHTSRAMSSRRGLTGNALEQALSALTDSLTANRGKLER